MNSFRRFVLPVVVLATVAVPQLASAHPGHSHEGVAGGEAHVTLLYVGGLLAAGIGVCGWYLLRDRKG